MEAYWIAPNGRNTIKPPVSKAGDSIVLKALEDCIWVFPHAAFSSVTPTAADAQPSPYR